MLVADKGPVPHRESDRLRWRAPLASAFAYIVLTAVQGRHVLGSLGSGVVLSPIDSLLNAAILAWNARHVPLTDAWWQFPMFYPTADTLAFSEHLLGVSVVSTPLYWMTGGNALATYNLTLLLTYPLCALGMYALVYRLTRSAPAAFLAGLAFGFAPYRASQLFHIQVLAVFWAPLALLGLHGYLETGRRGWLALFALGWTLQGAANGYFLVYFSVLSGLWVMWFVVAGRRWRELAMIGAAMAASALTLAPILYRYITVHERNGFFRSAQEIESFGADVAALLCAPTLLTFWGGVRVWCAPEAQLFAGVSLIALCCGGALAVRRRHDQAEAARHHALTFYVLATLAMWVLCWGPIPKLLGRPVLPRGPYAWLMWLPGGDGLRVPARFWMLVLICLAVVLGILVADLLRRRSRRATAVIVAAAAGALAMDGWAVIPVHPGPTPAPNPTILRDGTVLELPAGTPDRDNSAAYRAVMGQWRVANGYSGYAPYYYDTLILLSREEDDAIFAPFVADADLQVLVPEDAPRLRALVERQRDVELTGRNPGFTQYRLPRRGSSISSSDLGRRLEIRAVSASCSPGLVAHITDGNPETRWECGRQTADQEMTIDLGSVVSAGVLAHGLGPFGEDFPRRLIVDTSVDGSSWEAAWDKPLRGPVLAAWMKDRKWTRVLLPFTPRPTRFIRLRQVGRDDTYFWSIAELDVWSGAQ
jgi:hypothetical protein